MNDPAPRPTEPTRAPGAFAGVLALAVGVLWIAASAAAAIALLGLEQIYALSPVQLGALAGAVLLPALMIWFAGLAARDSASARAEARRLADAADRLLNPEQSAERSSNRLAETVRGEIATLDAALERTLARLGEVEAQIARQQQAVDSMSDQAKVGANQMISGMEREREELLRISRELSAQAETIGQTIARHTKSIAESARLAEAEVRAADQALDNRLTSFGAAAALINDRTQNLSTAAQTSADSALRLENALSGALDMLARATDLTDAARQSAEAAAAAANSAAGAVRDTTARAVDDAKRAAELIRSEAGGVEREAAAALERLREAAEAAREAAKDARAAAEETPEPAPARRRARSAPPPQPEQEESHYDASWRREPDPLDAPPPVRVRREPRSDSLFGERPATPRPIPGDWTWRDLLSSVNQTEESAEAPPPAPRGARASEPAADPVAHLRRPRGEAAPALNIVETIERAGLNFEDVFSPSGLERIAQRARSGTQSRRRAVFDCAPDAAHRLAEFLAADAEANQQAMRFLRDEGGRIAELLGRGRAAMNAQATRAFLLIDAAAG